MSFTFETKEEQISCPVFIEDHELTDTLPKTIKSKIQTLYEKSYLPELKTFVFRIIELIDVNNGIVQFANDNFTKFDVVVRIEKLCLDIGSKISLTVKKVGDVAISKPFRNLSVIIESSPFLLLQTDDRVSCVITDFSTRNNEVNIVATALEKEAVPLKGKTKYHFSYKTIGEHSSDSDTTD